MSKKKTHEQYVCELSIKNPNVQVAEQYINTDTAILHHCLIHDRFWKTTPSRALLGVGCDECKKERFRQTRCKEHEKYVEEVAMNNPDVVVVGRYIDAKTHVDLYCKKHDVFWSAYPDNVLRGCGCPTCLKEKIGEKNRKTHDQYVRDLEKANPNIEVIEEYRDAETSILHRCKIDGYTWSARPGNILFGRGCPKCNESHGERQVCQWLYNHNINYVHQKTFDDCRDQRLLPFDFYLPDYNLCIEYDGEQHFRPIELFGGKEGFDKRKHHDDIKNQYCKTNSIHLLRIPYFKNVEEELDNFYSFNIVTQMVV